MRDKLSGKPHDSSIGEEILHSVIPQRWRFLRQLLLTACPRKPQQYSVYARLENPFLAWAWRRKAWGLAIIQNAYQVDRRRPAKDNGTGCGKRLLLCQKKVNLKYVRFESKTTQSDERNTRAKDV